MERFSGTTLPCACIGRRPSGRAAAAAVSVLCALAGASALAAQTPAAGSAPAAQAAATTSPDADRSPPVAAHTRRALPFGPGEELSYELTAARFGRIGRGVMAVDGPDRVRDRDAIVLRFDLDGKVGPMRISDETRSWIDPQPLASRRYRKRERHPFADRVEEVEIFPEDRRWVTGAGESGRTASDLPLDELSFLYFIRTLDLADGAEYVVERHFDPERNPVVIRVLGREELAAPTGIFRTIVVEMQVRDGERFGGRGEIRLYLTDDANRYPVRVVTSVPLAGKLTLDLVSLIPGRALPDTIAEPRGVSPDTAPRISASNFPPEPGQRIHPFPTDPRLAAH